MGRLELARVQEVEKDETAFEELDRVLIVGLLDKALVLPDLVKQGLLDDTVALYAVGGDPLEGGQGGRDRDRTPM